MRKRRSGTDSRCCRPGSVDWEWIDFIDRGHHSVVRLDAWLRHLAPFARAHEEGEIDDLLEAASRGQLWDSGDETTSIKPILSHPEIFELRRTSLSKRLRFYHGEPHEQPDALVATHRHIKIDNESQRDEIAFAASRFVAGRGIDWNIHDDA